MHNKFLLLLLLFGVSRTCSRISGADCSCLLVGRRCGVVFVSALCHVVVASRRFTSPSQHVTVVAVNLPCLVSYSSMLCMELAAGQSCIHADEDPPELSVGLFSSTQPNPTRQITEPTQRNPRPGELMDPWPNPTYTQPNPLTSNNNWPAVRK